MDGWCQIYSRAADKGQWRVTSLHPDAHQFCPQHPAVFLTHHSPFFRRSSSVFQKPCVTLLRLCFRFTLFVFCQLRMHLSLWHVLAVRERWKDTLNGNRIYNGWVPKKGNWLFILQSHFRLGNLVTLGGQFDEGLPTQFLPQKQFGKKRARLLGFQSNGLVISPGFSRWPGGS